MTKKKKPKPKKKTKKGAVPTKKTAPGADTVLEVTGSVIMKNPATLSARGTIEIGGDMIICGKDQGQRLVEDAKIGEGMMLFFARMPSMMSRKGA